MTKIPLNVLFVDDEEVARVMLGRILGRIVEGHSLAANGKEALDLVANQEYDAVITDIRMPGMSGLELARQLKAKSPDLPVIVVTAHSEASYRKEADEVGVAAYLVKPVDVDDLIERFRQFAEKKPMQNQSEGAIHE